MRLLISQAIGLWLLAAAAGCVRTAAAPPLGYWVSSDSSQYSPNVRLHVVSAREGSTLTVVLDSGVITVPGVFTAESPVMMRNLYLTAYIAASNVSPIGLVAETRTEHSIRRIEWRFARRRAGQATAAGLRL